MNMLSRLYSWYGRTVVNCALALIVLLIGVGVIFSISDNDVAEIESTTPPRMVEVMKAGELTRATQSEIIGTVEAVDEAELQSEASGRIVKVPVFLSDRVNVGTIIVEIENSSERAQVLQAEGVYEAAVAAAKQSDTGVANTEVLLRTAYDEGQNAYRTSFITAEDVIRNTVDVVFSDPSGTNPGFRLDSLGQAPTLNQERKDVETLLRDWSVRVALNSDSMASHALLEEAEKDLLVLATFVQKISTIASSKQNDNREVSGTSIEAIRSNFTSARSAIDTILKDVQAKHAAIESAEYALENAKVSGTTSNISGANAQVKQALGALRAAEANLAKTIIRAPFSGTVNVLSVKVGDQIGMNAPIARIANNNALEITAYVNENERDFIELDQRVLIDDLVEGVITRIAPAIDPLTGKIEIEIGMVDNANLQNGDTVSISIRRNAKEQNEKSSVLTLPLKALKITPQGPIVFTVTDDELLVSNLITIGPVTGDSVVVFEGITSDTIIVTDARGLKEGAKVKVNNAN